MKHIRVWSLVAALLLFGCGCGKTVPANDVVSTYKQFLASENANGIQRYALYDISNDGIAELIVEDTTFKVFTFNETGVALAYEAASSYDKDSLKVVKQGIVQSKQTDAGIQYVYTSFTTDCRPENSLFTDANSDDPEAVYLFNGHSTTKEEWQSLTAPILSQNAVNLEWQTRE